ncbi:MAG: hypothetical protein GTN99_02910 [Candidatus Dadabacteria bacterium]|nr:hypothetical protein [Candidatus Dadabacteria bacterium]
MPTLGEKIDRLQNLRSQRKEAEQTVNDFKAQERELEVSIMRDMNDAHIERAAGSEASVTYNKNVVPRVTDWDAFHSFVYDERAFHLLERRASAAAYREELEVREGEAIPGVEPFTRETLSLRGR